MQKIRIVVVDDQELVREGFRKLLELEPDFEVVGVVADGMSAIEKIGELYLQNMLPDIVLMDIRMPRMNGIDATKEILVRWVGVRIVILTTFDDMELIQAGLQAGACGYLLKDMTSAQLYSVIQTVVQGAIVLQPDIARKAFASFSQPSYPSLSSLPVSEPVILQPDLPGNYIEQLTEREYEILKLVAQGTSNRQIGETLFLTEGTVKNYMSSILSKLGLRDRTQAAIKAKELGLI